jgi:hypothetical protein
MFSSFHAAEYSVLIDTLRIRFSGRAVCLSLDFVFKAHMTSKRYRTRSLFTLVKITSPDRLDPTCPQDNFYPPDSLVGSILQIEAQAPF